MLNSDLQPEKALSPMVVTLSGILTLNKLPQPKNAFSAIMVTPWGMTISGVISNSLYFSKTFLSSLKTSPHFAAFSNALESELFLSGIFKSLELLSKGASPDERIPEEKEY